MLPKKVLQTKRHRHQLEIISIHNLKKSYTVVMSVYVSKIRCDSSLELQQLRKMNSCYTWIFRKLKLNNTLTNLSLAKADCFPSDSRTKPSMQTSLHLSHRPFQTSLTLPTPCPRPPAPSIATTTTPTPTTSRSLPCRAPSTTLLLYPRAAMAIGLC